MLFAAGPWTESWVAKSYWMSLKQEIDQEIDQAIRTEQKQLLETGSFSY